MAVVSGLVCILIGMVRLGFVTELLSKPIRYGYMNGIALTVLISQLPKLFGFSVNGVGPLRDLGRITEGILGGQANWTSFAVSFSSARTTKRFPSSRCASAIQILQIRHHNVTCVSLSLSATQLHEKNFYAPSV